MVLRRKAKSAKCKTKLVSHIPIFTGHAPAKAGDK